MGQNVWTGVACECQKAREERGKRLGGSGRVTEKQGGQDRTLVNTCTQPYNTGAQRVRQYREQRTLLCCDGFTGLEVIWVIADNTWQFSQYLPLPVKTVLTLTTTKGSITFLQSWNIIYEFLKVLANVILSIILNIAIEQLCPYEVEDS